MATKLTGQELLDYIRENQDMDLTAQIAGAGYVATRNGVEGLQRQSFFMAIAAAQGVQLGTPANKPGTGKKAGYRLKVGPQGTIPVGPTYTKEMNWEPGSYVEVVKDGEALVLQPAPDPACGLTPMAA
jgi:hypothetical protein